MAKYDKTKKYWLQLKEDWFEEDAIKWLEEQKNGEKYSLFYLKMCLKSIKLGGFLIRQVGTILIPYDKNSLSELTKTDVDTVIVAMKLLEEIGLIMIKEDGAIYIEAVNNMIGSNTVSAIKKQRQRSLEERMLTISENDNYIKLNKLQNCKRIDATRILLPNDKIINVDEKRYGGNAGLLIDLAKGRCEDCGSDENICIHHENGFSNNIEDLVVLCSKCHGLHHRKDYIPKKYKRGTAVYSMSTKDKDIIKDIDINNNISSNEDIYVEQSSTNGTSSLESKQKAESKINSDYKQQLDSNLSFKINIVEEFLIVYNNYPCSKNKNKKKSLDLYFKWLTKGKIITLMDKKKRVKYNHLQMKFALKKFIADNEEKEEQYIPRLQTFLGENLICDYISKTKKSYENHMLKKYGEDWTKVKFEYLSEV